MLDKSSFQSNLSQSIILLITTIVLVIIGFFHALPPASTLHSADLSVFSSTRAMAHVWQIGANPHPTGTAINAEVRQYLIAELEALGFKPEIQSALVVNPQKKRAGRVNNVLIRIPGSKPSKALLLSAHYDSVHTGSGAADDGASVAAILETLRAIKSQSALQNDLICVFTDAEEDDLLGAEAFIRQHPWAKEIGLALNFEYRGNSGAFMMFETSTGNGRLIEGLATAAPFTLANSMMYEVYKHLPNDTDMTVFKQASIPGLNFAAIEGHTRYHTQLDRPELLDQDSLQQEGDIMLALVRHFGTIPLHDLQSKDRVYFDFPGLGLVNYPVSWVMPLNGILLLAFATVLGSELRAKTVRISRVVSGAIIFPVILGGLALASHFLWLSICQLHSEYKTFIQGDTYNSHWYLLAFVFLAIGLFGILQSYIYKMLKPIEYWFGVLVFWMLLLVLCSVWVPGASFLFYWPLAAMVLMFGLLSLTKASVSQPVAWLIFLGSMPGILMFTPIIRGLYIGLTPRMIGAVIVFLVLLLGLLIPLFEVINQRKKLLSAAFLLGIAGLVIGSLTSDFDEEHPRQNTLFYAVDGLAKQAFWLSTDTQLDEWTSTYFPHAQVKRQVVEIFGTDFPLRLWTAPAPLLTLQAPTIETLEDSVIDNKRTLKIKVKSQRSAPKMTIIVEGADVKNSKIAGQTYSKSQQPHWYVDSVGFASEELMIELTVKAGKPFSIRTIDYSYGLPDIMPRKRPSSMMSNPTEFSDTVAVINSRSYLVK